jgi:trehalose 6-phosphate phosphatase
MTNRDENLVEITHVSDFWQQVLEANNLFLGLDYDGTLAPFEIDPMQARPLPGIANLLQNLATGGRTQVAIISGRPVAEVMTLLDNPPVTVIGSHGYELWPVDGAYVVRQPTPEQRQGLSDIRTGLQQRGYGHKLEVKVASLALHTRGLEAATAAAMEETMANQFVGLAPHYNLECRRFNGGIEIRCSGWDKGAALTALLNVQPEDVFAVYVGDDETDEDAFTVLRNRGVGIKVGDPLRPTAARGFLPNCQAVVDFLRTWAELTATERR